MKTFNIALIPGDGIGKDVTEAAWQVMQAAAKRGEFELFKTSSIFDATAQHPEWLGEEPERIQKVIQA